MSWKGLGDSWTGTLGQLDHTSGRDSWIPRLTLSVFLSSPLEDSVFLLAEYLDLHEASLSWDSESESCPS